MGDAETGGDVGGRGSRSSFARFLLKPWCCGSLETAAVAIGVTNLVTLAILFLWIVQIILSVKHFIIAIVVMSMTTFILGVVNTSLLYAANNRIRRLLIPWLIVYSMLIPILIIACSVTYDDLGLHKPIFIVCSAILVYFFYVILAFYFELFREHIISKTRDPAELEKLDGAPRRRRSSDSCSIAMEEKSDGRGDDSLRPEETFTELASARYENGRDSSASEEPQKYSGNKNSFLPKPDEVIMVETLISNNTGNTPNDKFFENNPDLFSDQSKFETSPVKPFSVQINQEPLIPISQTVNKDAESLNESNQDASVKKPNAWQSLSGLFVNNDESKLSYTSEKDVTDSSCVTLQDSAVNGERSALSAPGKYQRAKPKAWKSHSGLLGEIDSSSFSPFKQKNSSATETPLPKMTIFLPKSSNDDEDDDDTSSDDDEEDDKEAKEKLINDL